MNETTQEIDTISVFVYDSISASEEAVVKIAITSDSQSITEDDALEYLADILVEIYIEQKQYEHTNKNNQ